MLPLEREGIDPSPTAEVAAAILAASVDAPYGTPAAVYLALRETWPTAAGSENRGLVYGTLGNGRIFYLGSRSGIREERIRADLVGRYPLATAGGLIEVPCGLNVRERGRMLSAGYGRRPLKH